MKKAIAMLAALTICCTAFTACGSSDSKSGKGAKKSASSFTLGEDGEEMPVAEKVYKAKKGKSTEKSLHRAIKVRFCSAYPQ